MQLADDLGHFLPGEPILARSVGLVERASKWCRRNRAVTLLMTVLVVSAIDGSWLGWKKLVALTQARIPAQNANEASVAAGLSAPKAETAVELAKAQAVLVQQEKAIADRARDDEAAAKREALKAQAEAEASERESRRRQVRVMKANGVRALNEKNLLAALPWFVDATSLEADDPERVDTQPRQVGSILDQAPQFAGQWREYGSVANPNRCPHNRRLAPFIVVGKRKELTSNSPLVRQEKSGWSDKMKGACPGNCSLPGS